MKLPRCSSTLQHAAARRSTRHWIRICTWGLHRNPPPAALGSPTSAPLPPELGLRRARPPGKLGLERWRGGSGGDDALHRQAPPRHQRQQLSTGVHSRRGRRRRDVVAECAPPLHRPRRCPDSALKRQDRAGAACRHLRTSHAGCAVVLGHVDRAERITARLRCGPVPCMCGLSQAGRCRGACTVLWQLARHPCSRSAFG